MATAEFSKVCCYPHIQRLSIINEAEVDAFFFFLLESLCFLYDPTNVGNLISSSSALSKSSLNTWKLSIHTLLKANLKDFEHYLASMQNERSCKVVYTFFGTMLL